MAPRNLALKVRRAGVAAVNGYYKAMAHCIPDGFRSVCEANKWETERTWSRLTDPDYLWFQHIDNGSYVYWNKGDGQWWMDGPDGYGVYVAKTGNPLPPVSGWVALDEAKGAALPYVEVIEGQSLEKEQEKRRQEQIEQQEQQQKIDQ
ncbi:unnamed protein product [Vitrella brassicaformis CCMP3155]|uniref:Uncharacterized protein n=1 Tax=Vitrella brassicaformis (strain CCMP3155) TaxID=1169540 RepID=A0A0G4G4J4_VITBC|nr:unnamed protein product [Vitrella brassicaformis CCMP3155]|eukprot:CEM22866.1 unnamed protein product [Vitrella brassicaformis CCMP3155]